MNLTGIDNRLAALQATLDQVFMLIMGIMILLMQCGFAFLEAGSVRSKNTSNILIKNLLDSFVAGLAYWIFGFPFAFGGGNKFIGYEFWASSDLDDALLAKFFFQFVFAATAATIVSGALAERCEFVAYFVYSFFITAFIYPVVTHWAWSDNAWLSQGLEYDVGGCDGNVTSCMTSIGYHDFAGSGVVHCVGGVAAFVGAAILGPRIGRFHRESGTSINLRGHSVPFAALGGFILLFGFMAFNGGSQLSISQPGDGEVVSLAIVNTVISGSCSAFVTLIIHRIGIRGKIWSLLCTLNGALAGMVAICAGCNVIRPWGASIVGAIAGLAFNITSWAMVKIRVDDPLDAVAVHFGGGAWGVISVAFLRYDTGILSAWDRQAGLMLAWQLAGLAVIMLWTGGLCVIMFGAMRLMGIFRVSEDMERKGLDIPKHGEPAYPLESYGHGYLEKIITILENGQLGHSNLGYHSNGGGHVSNGDAGKDDGMYESPEVKMMKHLNASSVPEFHDTEMNDYKQSGRGQARHPQSNNNQGFVDERHHPQWHDSSRL